MGDKLTPAQMIAAAVKALKINGTEVSRRQPQVYFQGSKGSIIDARKTDNVNALPNNLDFNRNYWNEKTFNLFNYLIGNYEKKGNIKYINIYNFLKSMNVNGYVFNCKQDDYRIFILSSFDVKLTKFAVANYKYEDIELPILSSLEEDFRKQTK